MNLVALETFLAILDEGSLVRAARRLHVTQSTVTARLRSLEAELGCELVSRSKAGATPTEAGRRLTPNAETILDLWNQALRDAALPNPIGGSCTFGCDGDAWVGLGSSVVSWIRRRDRSIALSVRTGRSSELAAWHRNGLVDVSLSYSSQVVPGYRSLPLVPDKLVLSSTNPHAPIAFDPGYVFVDYGEDFGRWHAETYATAGIAHVSFTSPDAALDHILDVGGTFYAPERMVHAHESAGRLHRISAAPTYARPTHLVVPETAADRWPWFEDLLTGLPGELTYRRPHS